MSRGSFTQRAGAEDGVALLHMAVALFTLMAISAWVLDYGVMWLGRREAQNAADAGALAGAIARAFDETTDPPAANGLAFDSAYKAARANSVIDVTPSVVVQWDCPGFAAGARCAHVDVYRDGTNGSTALPAFVAPMFGVMSQPVKATATAWVANANTTDCMRPFGVADKWNEIVAPAQQFDRWVRNGNRVTELIPHDIYTAPTQNSAGTGFHLGAPLPDDLGTELTLKGGNNPNSNADPITPGWYLPIRLPDGAGGYDSGADDYRANVSTCIGTPVTLGQYLPLETGVMNGPTSQGFDDLRALDPSATWNAAAKKVDNSCAPGCAPFSPRVIPLPVFDMDDFQRRRAYSDWADCPGGGRCVKVVNILGFFADRMSGNDIIGYLLTYPGLFSTGNPSLGSSSSFLKAIQLIR